MSTISFRSCTFLPLLFFGLFCGAASAAGNIAAPDHVYDRDGEHWIILVEPEKNACSMVMGFVDDVMAYIGEEDGQESIKFYFIFMKKGLNFAKDKEYRVEMNFIGSKKWARRAGGAEVRDYGGVYVRNLDSDFAVDVAREGALSIIIDGKDYGTYDLSGSKPGLLQLLKCRDDLTRGKASIDRR